MTGSFVRYHTIVNEGTVGGSLLPTSPADSTLVTQNKDGGCRREERLTTEGYG